MNAKRVLLVGLLILATVSMAAYNLLFQHGRMPVAFVMLGALIMLPESSKYLWHRLSRCQIGPSVEHAIEQLETWHKFVDMHNINEWPTVIQEADKRYK